MVGKNKILLNWQAMNEAVAHYLNSDVVSYKHAVTVYSVSQTTMDGGERGFEIKFQEREKSAAKDDPKKK